MSKQAARELLESLRPQYATADRKRKTELLSFFVESTGYNRKYTFRLLKTEQQIRAPRKGVVTYDDKLKAALFLLWEASNHLSSKWLVSFIPEVVGILERSGHLQLDDSTRDLLLKISPATIDRLLKPVRQATNRSKSFTKPGNLLKNQIPIRTFTEWDDAVPGFFEADLVSHSGPDASGQFLQTLTLTDIRTQWTECFALLRRGELEVRMALQEREASLPFPFKGLDTDNGFEFVNWNMLHWCLSRQITFTRGRPYKKNDQAHVEERNKEVVRKLTGYERLEGRVAQRILAEFYDVVRLYQNFFQPSQKLVKKTRNGAKVYRKHDRASTPYQRVLESPHVEQHHKDQLSSQYLTLNPLELLGKMHELQAQLHKLAIPSVFPTSRKGARKAVKANLQDILTISIPAEGKISVRQLIETLPPGCTFQAIDLERYKSRTSIDAYLSVMHKRGKILKVGWGVYKTLGEEQDLLPLTSNKKNEATVS